jgi:hypothetical protein
MQMKNNIMELGSGLFEEFSQRLYTPIIRSLPAPLTQVSSVPQLGPTSDRLLVATTYRHREG